MPQSILVPPIYFWVEEYNGKPTVMTAAVRWNNMNFGLSFPIAENFVRMNMDKKKLVTHLKEVVSVLVLHGKTVLDGFSQIDPRLVNDQEAIRWKFDPVWDRRVNTVNRLMKVKDITKDKAVELELI